MKFTADEKKVLTGEKLVRCKARFELLCEQVYEELDFQNHDTISDWNNFESYIRKALVKFGKPPLSELNSSQFSIEQQTDFLFELFVYCKIQLRSYFRV